MRVAGIPLGVLAKKDNTLIALSFDTDYTDSSRFAHVFTSVGTAPTILSGVANFNGSGAISTPDSSSYDTQLTTGDFTIEARLKLTTLNLFNYVLNKVSTGDQPYSLFFDSSNSLRALLYRLAGGGVSVNLSSSPSVVNDNNFHHVALTRQGNIFRLFLDGLLVNSITNATMNNLVNNTDNLIIGAQTQNATGSNNLKGQIDWLKISGMCLYTTNFTPPLNLTL